MKFLVQKHLKSPESRDAYESCFHLKVLDHFINRSDGLVSIIIFQKFNIVRYSLVCQLLANRRITWMRSARRCMLSYLFKNMDMKFDSVLCTTSYAFR